MCLAIPGQIVEMVGDPNRIEAVSAAGRCRGCGEYGPLGNFLLSCARCGALDVEVLEGEDLEVEAVEVETLGVECELARSGGSP